MNHKYVYLFTEGNGSMRELLGGKGANLAEMTNIGLPVPQGFTISTEACPKTKRLAQDRVVSCASFHHLEIEGALCLRELILTDQVHGAFKVFGNIFPKCYLK